MCMCACVFACTSLCETNIYALRHLFPQQGASKRGTRVCFEEGAWSAHPQLDLSWHCHPVSKARHALAMAVACGDGFTIVVTEQGDAWACGTNEDGQLGLGDNALRLLPSHVGGHEVFAGEALVMISAGSNHTAGVTTDGALWSWGHGFSGQLGHGDREPRQRPERLGREMFGGSPAVMVGCGNSHMLVLTVMGFVWSCGEGGLGRLGHGDETDQLVLMLVAAERFGGGQIVMVAAGGFHSVALGEKGRVWTWGHGGQGQLGHNDEQNRLIPTLLTGEALGGSAAVLVASGRLHTVVVMIDGTLWAWGNGHYGQLGLGDTEDRLVPVRVVVEEEFGGSPVLMAACGDRHTLAVTKAGILLSWGEGCDGALGHNDENDRLVPTQVEVQHFGHLKIVSAAAGVTHSAAVTEHGCLYTWGRGTYVDEAEDDQDDQDDQEENEVPFGHGHVGGETKLVPTRVAPALLQGARVGRCHGLLPLHALAFAMGNHSRLGRAAQTAPAAADNDKDCEYVLMPGELVQRIVEACGAWPEGRAGELVGLVRLLGSGMIDKWGST